MKKIFLLLFGTATLLGNPKQPFSLEKLEFLKDFKIKKPHFIKASDDIQLAYYSYMPQKPRAIVIFYHGAGFYGSSLYQYFANELAQKHTIGCYVFDIRGHGNSQGRRGDAPSMNQVLDDVTTAVEFVAKQHPSISLYLGGHSSGGGMVLNYSNYNHHQAIKGYLLIAPYLGRNSGAIQDHADPAESFAKSVRVWVFILNALSGGYFFSHTPSVFFNYPKELIEKEPKIVTSYTVPMMAATSPENPQELFAKIDKAFLLLAGKNDEQFVASNVVEYKNFSSAAIAQKSTAEIIPAVQHLDILLNAAGYCAKFIQEQ
ncbi:alpha/beta fold hydrolase [Candidatus Dependentiae bacterium]|nr:alpha/beta fold hydrolase [Candidatus Dependentiae bacterium]